MQYKAYLNLTYSLSPVEYKIRICCVLLVGAWSCRGPPDFFVPIVFSDYLHLIFGQVPVIARQATGS